MIGVATSDLYPRFSIDGSIGVSAEDFEDVFKTPGAMTGFIGPSFRWDILNYGRIGNNVAAQEARFRESVANYQESVLRANREAEDAIIAFLKMLRAPANALPAPSPVVTKGRIVMK